VGLIHGNAVASDRAYSTRLSAMSVTASLNANYVNLLILNSVLVYALCKL